MASIIPAKQKISKFFFDYGFHHFLTSVSRQRLSCIIIGLAMKGNQSRTTDFSELKQACRAAYGHLLSSGKREEKKVSQQQQREAFRVLSRMAKDSGKPLYLCIDDDTVVRKKCPSSRAKCPTEGISLIWKGNRYLAIKFLLPISAQGCKCSLKIPAKVGKREKRAL